MPSATEESLLSATNPIPDSNLYEVVFHNQNIDSKIRLKIDNVKIEGGALFFERHVCDVRDYGHRLTPESSVEILPQTWGALRACALPGLGSSPPKGSFTVTSSSGEPSWTISYPWKPEAPPPRVPIPVKVSFNIPKVLYPDVMIVGSGPLGATYARTIFEKKPETKILMVEMGARESAVVGEHKKNTVRYQRDIDRFVNVIKGALNTLSIPPKPTSQSSPRLWGDTSDSFVQAGNNPQQKPEVNLSASAATRVVGGMATHWTCCTPEQLKGLERADTFSDSEWSRLYAIGREYLRTSTDQFNESGRHQLVLHTLKERFPVIFPPKPRKFETEGDNPGDRQRIVGSMPLACKRSKQDPNFVFWSAVNTILGKTVDKLNLLPNHQCSKLLYDHDKPEGDILLAVLKNLKQQNSRVYVWAKNYVVCAGAVLTPQILFNSGFRAKEGSLPALGKYLTEQTMAFCQVMLYEHLVFPLRNVDHLPDWLSPEVKKKIKEHKKKHPEDPVPFPFRDPEPQVYTPVQSQYPWHTQIHCDAFSYGDVAPNLDSRLIVDLRWFGMVEPVETNCVTFSAKYHDQFSMPQPTFNYVLDEETNRYNRRMMDDMTKVAMELGRYIAGSEPQFMEPGLALHVCGTTRVGTSVKDSVVDENSKVWNVGNLWIGSNGVIRTKNACNPTLTSMCYAIKGAEAIAETLK